jgi:1-acyl-sn-glycerol-3-phosphate acyltransferase
MTRLPKITTRRNFFRLLLRNLARLVLFFTCRVTVTGLTNFPAKGPAIIVLNHLGDTDVVLGLAYLPSTQIQTLAKIDLYVEYPLLGWLLETYGVIWLHRGAPDRRALHAALAALQLGQLVAIAPEGRESLSGEMEAGLGGAAYLAIKAGVGVIPIGFTGTKNSDIYGKIKHFKKADVTMRVGKMFHLEEHELKRNEIRLGTLKIMKKIAEQIPPEYRGVYK